MSARGGKKKGKKKTPAWRCNWCQTSKTARQNRGPDGPKTLCGTCHTRWRKAATDATAGALVQVKREKEALEDRLLCTICMEADAPRTVLFGPCNHFLACASCAAALQECPNCRVPITARTAIANTS